MPDSRPHRDVVSFVRRSARMNASQRGALRRHRARYVLDVPSGELDTSVSEDASIDWAAVFGREAPLCVEIGSGTGDSLVAMAAHRPGADVVAFEVYERAVASTLGKLARAEVRNVRVAMVDGVQGLERLFDEGAVSELWTFFPDPWHKTRHHKRRLVSRGFGDLVASRLRPDGVWRIATDWEEYAWWMREELDDHPRLRNLHDGWAPRLAERPVTKYEARGLAAGRQVYDLAYGVRA